MINEKENEQKFKLIIEIHNKASSIPMSIIGNNGLNIPIFTTEIAIYST